MSKDISVEIVDDQLVLWVENDGATFLRRGAEPHLYPIKRRPDGTFYAEGTGRQLNETKQKRAQMLWEQLHPLEAASRQGHKEFMAWALGKEEPLNGS